MRSLILVMATVANAQSQVEKPMDEPQASVCRDSVSNDSTRVVVHQAVTPGLLIHKVAPQYPKAARKAHIEGTVLMCAVIAKDGRVANLRVVSGPNELVGSALKAVHEWVYKPYLLDGQPVDVVTEIRVNFQLQ
jgi:TonB family protein